MGKKCLTIFFAIALFFNSCSKEEEACIRNSNEFTVHISNLFQENESLQSGVTGVIEPGATESYRFHAGKGHHFQFAMMLLESNDLFYAPADTGIPLYDENGNALTGDITSFINLWDGGTEINEPAGIGSNQPPRQAAINTGASQDGLIRMLKDVPDGFDYPQNEEVLRVSLSHDGGTKFTLVIENISNEASLTSHLASGVWAVHKSGAKPIFEEGTKASPAFELTIEDGMRIAMADEMNVQSGFSSSFAPGAYTWGTKNIIFKENTLASEILEALAEDGNTELFVNSVSPTEGNVMQKGILPQETQSFRFTAETGEKLSFASMLVESNDWFIGLDNIDLYHDGSPISGDITHLLKLYDAGTEVDEYAGAGNKQAPRQAVPNTGLLENLLIEEETAAGSHVPGISDYIRITISN